MQATVKGMIDEDGQRMLVAHQSVESAHGKEAYEVTDLDEEADDFMETYLAINLELKVRET